MSAIIHTPQQKDWPGQLLRSRLSGSRETRSILIGRLVLTKTGGYRPPRFCPIMTPGLQGIVLDDTCTAARIREIADAFYPNCEAGLCPYFGRIWKAEYAKRTSTSATAIAAGTGGGPSPRTLSRSITPCRASPLKDSKLAPPLSTLRFERSRRGKTGAAHDFWIVSTMNYSVDHPLRIVSTIEKGCRGPLFRALNYKKRMSTMASGWFRTIKKNAEDPFLELSTMKSGCRGPLSRALNYEKQTE